MTNVDIWDGLTAKGETGSAKLGIVLGISYWITKRALEAMVVTGDASLRLIPHGKVPLHVFTAIGSGPAESYPIRMRGPRKHVSITRAEVINAWHRR